MKAIVLLIAMISPAAAQVTALFTPVSLAGASASTGPAKEAGTWNVHVCSSAQLPLALPWQRVLLAAPSIRSLTTAQANKLLTVRTKRNWKSVAARGLGYAAAGVAIGVFPPAAAALPFIDLVHDKIAAEAPVFVIDNPVPDVINLAPGACFTGTFLASKMPDVKPLLVELK